MAFAYFMSHAPRGFFPISTGGNGGESAILYCFIFLYFCFVGAGIWSLDEMRSPAGRASAIPSRSRR
jgi:putative oxidoreductase